MVPTFDTKAIDISAFVPDEGEPRAPGSPLGFQEIFMNHHNHAATVFKSGKHKRVEDGDSHTIGDRFIANKTECSRWVGGGRWKKISESSGFA
jgi:hypothetical protein